jgi:1,4-alpha-glucan branching enzyme
MTERKARPVAYDAGILTPADLHLFNEGSHFQLYRKMGGRPGVHNGVAGSHFAVWAPDAAYVSVIGDFNAWTKGTHPLQPLQNSGIWQGFVPGVGAGAHYKYHVASRHRGYRADKADPFGFRHETPPKTASIVWELDYEWGDGAWMALRHERNALTAPLAIYELHVGSWRHEVSGRSFGYRELAPRLADYVHEMGFTHVELMPVMEHPFYGSWGYQTTGYFAPTSRFGSPQDLMYLIDLLHQRGIGVLLDWVPSHFPTDEHGLGFFDGTHLYEHADPQEGFHPDWRSYIFNYGRNEVRSFLISGALFWLDHYHVDGLRVDAVASMLYRDYSREAGEWIPNEFGGRENLQAISFLRRLNEEVYRAFPDVQVVAEESTAWPMVSRPTYVGGLGFGAKWDMGWMHDTLQYFSHDPIHRAYHHHELTFRMVYAFHENFVLPLSHDEVVHGKGSLLGKMPGDVWQKLANLRLLYGYMYAQPGKKMLFMGGEFGQWREWNHDAELDWDLLTDPRHLALRRWVADLNRLYAEQPALHRLDNRPDGFEWVDANDSAASTLAFLRRSGHEGEDVLAAFNFTPVVRDDFRIGVPRGGFWRELLNSDAEAYGGSGMGNLGGVEAEPVAWHGRPFSLRIALPPLCALFFGAGREAKAVSRTHD